MRPDARLAAFDQRNEQQRHGDGQISRAGVIDHRMLCALRLDQCDADYSGGGEAERDVDVEDPSPRPVIGDEAAGQRAEYRSQSPDATEQALHIGALAQRIDVAGDGHRQRDQAARAQTLNGAKENQLRDRL